jgi:multimeric flavodoxin WrbA
MNILLINGSNRKNGTCLSIANKLSIKLKTLDQSNKKIKTTIFSLAEKNITFCKGCLSCCADKNRYCYIKDDIYESYKLMEKADSIIFISPIYECFIPGILKNFFDRTNHYTSFYKLAGKPINLILCGVQPLKGKTKEFSNKHVIANINNYFKNYSIITHTKYNFLDFFQAKSHHLKEVIDIPIELEQKISDIANKLSKQKINLKLLDSGKIPYII